MTITERTSDLATEAWDLAMAAAPLYATAIGDHRFDDRLPPVTEAERSSVIERLSGLLVRATADAADDASVTASALRSFLELQMAIRSADVGAWTVDPLDGPQVEFLNVASYQEVDSVEDGEAMLARWQAIGPWIDAHTANVREAMGDGRVSPASPIRRVIDQLDDLLGRPDEDWPLLEPLAVERPAWRPADRDRFDVGLRSAVREGARPAFARYRSALVDEVLPRARPDDRPGLLEVPGGRAAYAGLAHGHTTLALSPEEIHRVGLDEVARIDAELADLAARVLGIGSLSEAQDRLRTDPALHFADGADVLDTARRSLDRALQAIPAWFGTLPKTPCEVVEIPRHEAEHSTIAYYRDPSADGSRPGRFYVNTSHPETRPRYEAEALAFHESIPGHHLQLALGQEQTGLPAFRRFGTFTAYVEGWGLYTERLSDEMGLYSSDLDRIGVLSFDGWRACRLVVDTGMHALGWSRARAIEFMTVHTALAPNNIANEVDRYISIPGQALAYKIGQLELLRLRADARERLGSAFDIRSFHDAVLCESALPLPVLAEVIDRWASHGRE